MNSFGQNNDGLPTYPYGPPLVDHVGRYVDSQNTPNFQHIGFRTAKARGIRVFPQQAGQAPPRIYIQIGNAVGAYALDTFFSSRLPGGMVSVGTLGKFTGSTVGGLGRSPLEKIAMWDGFMYPEAVASQWYVPLIDKQDTMGKGGAFDQDDRGNLYSIHSFGWGIAQDDGRTSGSHFTKVVQLTECFTGVKTTGTLCDVAVSQGGKPPESPNTRHDGSDVSGQSIMAVRDGNKYYAIVGGGSKDQAVFDVTDATSPRLVVTRPGYDKSIFRYDRSDAFSRVAYVDSKQVLHVYSYTGLINGTEIGTYASRDGGFVDVAIDESGTIWAAESSRVLRLTPAGSGYTESEFTPFGAGFRDIEAISAGAGHIVALGTDYSIGARYDVRLAKIEAAGPRLVDTDNFFKNYYHGGRIGYSEPGQYTDPFDVQIMKWNGKTYLFYSASGLGDVFEIQAGDSISVARTSPAQGPYPGDVVTFMATSSNPAVAYDVSWDFGNDESAPNDNDLEKTGIPVHHQYTGLTTATSVTAVKSVRAVTIQDPAIGAQLNVSLKLPAPRIGVPGLSTAITASTTGLKVVAGGEFADASDGTIDGHYGVWTLGGTPTKFKPDQPVPIGDLGVRTMKFEAFYGKYTVAGTTFSGTAPYPAPAITVGYTVVPFKARINTPATAGSKVRFSATPDVTDVPLMITATNWTVTWSLSSGSAAGGVATTATPAPLTGPYPVGTIPNYDIEKADIPSGSKVTLLIVIDPAGLSTPAQAYNQATDEMTLTTPNPAIEKTGCVNAGSPCTFTAKTDPPGGSTEGWTYLWTLKRNGATIGTNANNPYQPALATAGSHTITLKASKTVFEKEVSLPPFEVEASLCGALPTSTQVTINKIGCSSSCAPGTNITFAPSYNGYTKQSCDSFSWSFGDGTSATGEEVTHSYSTAGTRTVTFSITNTNGTFSKTTTVTVTGGGTVDPPPPGCTKPLSANFSYTGCSGTCRTTDSIKFTATKNNGASLQTCDATAWTFGDTTTTGVKSPSKTFSAGTYTVSLVISNSEGTSNPVEKQITIAAPTSGNCGVAPGPGNFAITFTGAQSGCTVINAQSCKAGEALDFISNSYIYPVASCDSFEWDFGDSAKSSARNPQHAYTNDGTYNVQMKVSNSTGSFTYSRSVVITGGTPAKPLPVITGTFPATGQKGKVITFTAGSNMDTTTGWTWTFGDGSPADTSQAGSISQTSTVTHTFNSAGTFTVIAKARNSTDVASAPSGSKQAQIVITNPPAIPEFMYLLPVAVHAKGQNNSSWRTDVQIYNPDPLVSETKPLVMEALFKGKPYQLEMFKATHIYEDFLGSLLSQQRDDQGPIIITTKSAMTPPQIWTRTYNQTEAGLTFGQFIPAIRLDTGGAGGSVDAGAYYLSGLRHDNRYRTNVGFINPNAAAVTATITVYDEVRLKLGEYTETLQPFQLVQYPLKSKETETFKLPAEAPFSVKIAVPAGQWLISYASFIDGVSNDPVFLQAVRESDVASADYKTTVIPGVGHTGPWRSDITVFNPDVDAMQLDLHYFNSAGEKKGEALGIVLGSGKFLQYGDILKQGVLGNVDDGFGMLKLAVKSQHEKYPMTFSRTYFDDVANGTYGQGIGAFSAARANVKPNKPAFIAGVRKTAHYRTNIGLLNLSNAPVTVTVTLLDPFTGAAAGSIDYPMAPNQSILGSFNGFGAMESGTLRVTANGDVWAFASIIDNHSQDPEYVPATPLQ